MKNIEDNYKKNSRDSPAKLGKHFGNNYLKSLTITPRAFSK